MTDSTSLLYGTSASIALVHTLLGPDHYLPFIAMARAGKWSLTKTIVVTVLCGVGHVLSSVAIGAIGIVFGVAVLKLESVESFRSELTGYLMIGFGLIYFVWGVRHALRNKPHSHWHVHADGSVHTHEHTHVKEHLHVHNNPNPDREGGATFPNRAHEEAATFPNHAHEEAVTFPNRAREEAAKESKHRVPLAAGLPVIRDATERERENYELQITNYEKKIESSKSNRDATVREREETSFPPYQGGIEGGVLETGDKKQETRHNEKENNESSTLTPWILFTIFLFGPCELLIPVLMYPAAAADMWSVVGVTLVFGVITIATMTLIVACAHLSMNRVFSPTLTLAHRPAYTHRPVWTHRITRSPLFLRLSQFSHALAGVVILLCGSAMMIGW